MSAIRRIFMDKTIPDSPVRLKERAKAPADLFRVFENQRLALTSRD
jgi:hypothetical protein